MFHNAFAVAVGVDSDFNIIRTCLMINFYFAEECNVILVIQNQPIGKILALI